MNVGGTCRESDGHRRNSRTERSREHRDFLTARTE
jgi:hypothetical protein